MLARLAVLLVALPALALAADVGAGRSNAAQASAHGAVQRVATATIVRPPAQVSVPADPAECQMGCAQTYYVCRGGDHPEECAGPWGQCVATCNAPNLAGYSTAP